MFCFGAEPSLINPGSKSGENEQQLWPNWTSSEDNLSQKCFLTLNSSKKDTKCEKKTEYFLVYCYSKGRYNGASAEHDNMKFIRCAKTSDTTETGGVHLCEPIKATKKTEHKTSRHAVEGLASHSKATEHLRWLPCSKAPQKILNKDVHLGACSQNRTRQKSVNLLLADCSVCFCHSLTQRRLGIKIAKGWGFTAHAGQHITDGWVLLKESGYLDCACFS